MAELIIHSGDDYADAFANDLPTGPAWPRDPTSTLIAVVTGLAQIWGDVDSTAATLLQTELDPRTTFLMLPDWERNFGLPDLCLAEPLTIGNRQQALVVRMTMLGGQSRAWFEALAASIGYTINIVEHSPYQCGISQCGNTMNWNGEGADWHRWELGEPTIRFWWTVAPLNPRLTWFRCGGGGGQCGVDPSLIVSLLTDLECSIRRYHPAHTTVNFSYSGLLPLDSMAGTP